MSLQQHKELARRMIDEVWNAGDLRALPEFCDQRMSDETLGLHRTLTGAFPDLRIHIEDLIAEGDRIVARLTFEGTHQGDFRGMAPTGRRVRFTAIRIYRISDGKFVETWANQDGLGLLQQLQGSPPA